jgi:hypothetical protein
MIGSIDRRTRSKKEQNLLEKVGAPMSSPQEADAVDIIGWDHSSGHPAHALVRLYKLPEKTIVVASELDSNKLFGSRGYGKANSMGRDFAGLANEVAKKYEVWDRKISPEGDVAIVEWLQHYGAFSSYHSDVSDREEFAKVVMTTPPPGGPRHGFQTSQTDRNDEVLTQEAIKDLRSTIELLNVENILKSSTLREKYMGYREKSLYGDINNKLQLG